MEKIKAFTMAEVLITLGVIGIVACMTMPGVIKNYQKKVTVERLKQTYSMLMQAVRMSEAKNGQCEDWILPAYTSSSDTNGTKEFVKMYFEPYLQTIHSDKMASSKAPYAYKYYNNDGKLIETTSHTHYSIALINGVYLHFNANTVETKPRLTVRVDINGKQRPNIVGIDTFYMYVYPKFEMVNEQEDRDTLLRLCKEPGNLMAQESCGAIILHDGWEIRDDYPWR